MSGPDPRPRFAARITGMGAVTPLGLGVGALFDGALRGVVALRPSRRLSMPELAVPVGEIAGIDDADDPALAPAGRASILAELAAREALDGSGWGPAELCDPKTALIVSTTKAGIGRAQRHLETGGATGALALRGFPLSALAAGLARSLGLRGHVTTLSLACASGTSAVDHARSLLRRGTATRVLVVGVDALSEFVVRGFASLRALDPMMARPFDARRAGLSVGEGAAAITLEAGSGHAHALVTGAGGSNDAHHITGPARDGAGLVRAVRAALADAGQEANDLGFISAHATGTRFNDLMECQAWRALLGPNVGDVPVHGLKGAIGHTLGAAGLIEVVLTARVLETGRCPPTAGLTGLDPEIDLQVFAGASRALNRPLAVTTSSGFAGVNAAVVLEASP